MTSGFVLAVIRGFAHLRARTHATFNVQAEMGSDKHVSFCFDRGTCLRMSVRYVVGRGRLEYGGGSEQRACFRAYQV